MGRGITIINIYITYLCADKQKKKKKERKFLKGNRPPPPPPPWRRPWMCILVWDTCT